MSSFRRTHPLRPTSSFWRSENPRICPSKSPQSTLLRWGCTLFASSVSALVTSVAVACSFPPAFPQAPAQSLCRHATFEGEVTAGQPYTHPLGNGLVLFLQPIHSGWILRVLPASGPIGDHDYAELATPPYQSVTPLSISTDFSFRAQDAVGWNPRRFRFATSKAAFDRLSAVYQRFEQAGATPPAPLQLDLATEIAQASEGSLTLLDVRLLPGTADQSRSAAAVASHFSQTAHTVVQAPDTPATQLGKLLWIRFRVDLDLPPGFLRSSTLSVLSTACSAQSTNLQRQ